MAPHQGLSRARYVRGCPGSVLRLLASRRLRLRLASRLRTPTWAPLPYLTTRFTIDFLLVPYATLACKGAPELKLLPFAAFRDSQW